MKSVYNFLFLLCAVFALSCEGTEIDDVNSEQTTETQTESEGDGEEDDGKEDGSEAGGDKDTLEVPDGYIAIYTAEQLASIGVNDSYPLDASYILMNDLDLSAYDSWTPIGVEYDTSFCGIFDGNNKTISNLTIDSDVTYAGLFGCVIDSYISNLTLSDTKIKCGYRSGSMIGNAYSSTITSCHNIGTGSLVVEVDGVSYTGGLIGAAYDTSNITYCHNEYDVSGSSSSSPAYAGGVCGYSGASTITSCYNTGTISASSDGSSAYSGGVCGFAISSSSVTSCYNTGTISAISDSNYAYSGGVCGRSYASSTIALCYNSGSVSGSSNSSFAYVGGVCGYAYYIVTSCFNKGSVSSDSECYVVRIGGICGYANSSSVTSCANEGNITSNANTTSVMGGICGYSSSTIESCYNTGNITSNYASSGVEIAGICGVTYANISASYNTGDILSMSTPSNTFIGGIIGMSYFDLDFTSCYNTGYISGNVGESFYMGYICGTDDTSSTFTSCYYLPNSSTNYTNTNGTADSNLISTMTSTSFPTTLNTAAEDSHWAYDSSNINGGYPILTSIDYN